MECLCHSCHKGPLLHKNALAYKCLYGNGSYRDTKYIPPPLRKYLIENEPQPHPRIQRIPSLENILDIKEVYNGDIN